MHLSSEQHGHAMPHHLPSVCRTELQSKYHSKCVESDEISQQLEALPRSLPTARPLTPAAGVHAAIRPCVPSVAITMLSWLPRDGADHCG